MKTREEKGRNRPGSPRVGSPNTEIRIGITARGPEMMARCGPLTNRPQIHIARRRSLMPAVPKGRRVKRFADVTVTP